MAASPTAAICRPVRVEPPAGAQLVGGGDRGGGGALLVVEGEEGLRDGVARGQRARIRESVAAL